MAAKPIYDEDDNPIWLTCENRKFKTNVNKGFSHGKGNPRGSVFPDPLVDNGSYSLWLEHVISKDDGKELYWLMWYDGMKPTIPLSGVFGKEDLKGMISKLTTVRDELL